MLEFFKDVRYFSLNDMILKYCNVRIITPIEATSCRKLAVLCIADIYVFKPQCESVLTGKYFPDKSLKCYKDLSLVSGDPHR